MLGSIIDFVLNVDKYIAVIISSSGPWVYLILFLVVFCETGLVFVPFLPGDSLLFASGAFSASGAMDIKYVYLIFLAASIVGDTVNYHIGRFIGPKIFNKKDSRLFKKEHLDKAHNFYEKYGGAAIILARFMPIIRTFAPFVAGAGSMTYIKFLCYNVIGGAAWVSLFVFAGYFFGNIPFIKDNFSIVVYVIILISLLPAVIGVLKSGRAGAFLKNMIKRMGLSRKGLDDSTKQTGEQE